jgi:methyltransferase (TIGR00027 family)
MNEYVASRTALVTSLMRARHTRLDQDPLIDDSLGDRLVPDSVRAALRVAALAAMDADARARALASPDSIVDDYLRANPAYANVILRSRYTEDALRIAVAKGIRQYVTIGAGFDSFSLRRPAFASELDVFEIDHPATQELKIRRMKECGLSHPDSTHFIAADLSAEDIASALSRSPFRSAQPTFFSWLGVTMYLSREANLASLRAIAKCAGPGSELVFTYLDEIVLKSRLASDAFRKLRKTVATVGEPFLSGFDPSTIAEELRRVDLALVEDLDGEQMAARYKRVGSNALVSAATSHIVRARQPVLSLS